MIHDLPEFRFFNDPSIRKVTKMEVEAFKQSLDKFIEDANIGSKKILKTRPRFIYAVAVLADPLKSGEIMKATCIKQLDPYHIVIESGQMDPFQRHRRAIEIEKVEGFDELIQSPKIHQGTSQQSQQKHLSQAQRKDSEIEAALKILQESRDLLEDTAMSIKFPSEIRARRTSAYCESTKQ
jgi:5S rRNA maturation endonuclease (ribonuclease M5)